MARWETDWERQRRRAEEEARESEFMKMLKTTLWAIGIAAVVVWGFLELQRDHFQVVIKHGKNEPDQNQHSVTPVGVRAAAPQDIGKDAGEYKQSARDNDFQPVQIRQAAPKRSVQEEYEMASRIMESTAHESRQARISEQVIRNGYGTFPDQLSFNYWWLDSYESVCLPQARDNINYRHCRSTWKQQWLDQCRDRVLRFEGLSSAQRDNERPINEAQCYAANNYRIVE